MKKILTALVCVAMLALLCIPFTASAEKKAQDITDTVKFNTAVEMYVGKLKIVRDDATFLDPTYDLKNDPSDIAGNANRTIYVNSSSWENYSNDEIFYCMSADDVTSFIYPVIWANKKPMAYEFTITEEGDYEFVVVGCAQIKADAVDNDAKDRGFCVSVDDGQIYQVNASDTKAIFRDYSYTYTVETALAGIPTTNGVNSQEMQFGYWYNIVLHLTKGTHTFYYYNMNYSGDSDFDSEDGFATGSRLNYAGTFVQKYLTEAQLAAYEYPVVTTAEETTAAATTPVTTAEVTTAEVTTAAEVADTTAAAVVTTTAPAAKSGCGSVIGSAIVVIASILGTAVVVRKKN